MKKEEYRGEQSSSFFLSIGEDKYFNGTLIRNDEPKAETNFILRTNCVHVVVAKVIISSQSDGSEIETKGEQLVKVVVNEDETKLKEVLSLLERA